MNRVEPVHEWTDSDFPNGQWYWFRNGCEIVKAWQFNFGVSTEKDACAVGLCISERLQTLAVK